MIPPTCAALDAQIKWVGTTLAPLVATKLDTERIQKAVDILLTSVRISGGGKFSFNGYDEKHRVGAKLDNVLITDGAAYTYSLHHLDLVLGPGAVNMRFAGGGKISIDDSTVKGSESNGWAEGCAEKFVAFPLE